MSKVEAFKSKFLPNSKLATKLAQRVTTANADIQAAQGTAATLPVGHLLRTALETELTNLINQVQAQQQAGTANPGEAWRAMGPLCEQAAAKKTEVADRVAKEGSAQSERKKRYDARLNEAQKVLEAGRAQRRSVVNEKEAARLDAVLTDLRQRIEDVSRAVVADPYAVQKAYNDLDGLLADAKQVLVEAESAEAMPADAGSKRAVSRATVDAIAGVEVFGQRLGSDKRDRSGRTPMDHARARLDAFDEHFAADEAAQPDAKRKNAAMRVAAVVSVTARDIALEKNDPYLEPRIAQLLLQEYEKDLAGNLATRSGTRDTKERVMERQSAEGSMGLARALVMDDPVMKLLTGKINPDDAVQRVRDMAAVGGETPSEMLRLLRQQAEMRIGSLTGAEVRTGEKKNDPGQGFVQKDMLGELNEDQFEGIAVLTRRQEDGSQKADLPVWKSGSGAAGLELQVAGKQIHTVKKGDTLQVLAARYLPDVPIDAATAQLIDANKVVLVPPTGKPVIGVKGKSDQPNSLQKQQPTELSLTGFGPGRQLPLGVALRVPAQASVLDQLAAYVAAWDTVLLDGPVVKAKADTPPDQPVQRPDNLPKITPQALRDAAAQLTDPRDSDRNPNRDDRAYIPAPGVGQEFRTSGVLDDAGADIRVKNAALQQDVLGVLDQLSTLGPDQWGTPAADPLHREFERLTTEINENNQTAKDAEEEARRGAINERQYAHLRLLQRADAEDKETFLAEHGMSVEDWVKDKLASRYDTTRSKAEGMITTLLAAIESVPISVTFPAEKLFSDPTKDEPAFGDKYGSDVVYSRGSTDVKDLIGRADNVAGQVGVTGGTGGGWEERGKSYMLWRREKDSREGRRDDLAYEDQQIFSAMNPNFDELKGGGRGNANPHEHGKYHGKNFYGNAHFLLRDEVRSRVAFAVRGGSISIGGGATAVQRKDIMMMLYDMLKGATANMKYVDAMLLNAKGADKIMLTGLDWEAHLYGGFDMAKDAKAMFLPPTLDKEIRATIDRFGKKNNIDVQDYGGKLTSLEIIDQGVAEVKQYKLGDI